MPHCPRILIVNDTVDHRLSLRYHVTRSGTFDSRTRGEGNRNLFL